VRALAHVRELLRIAEQDDGPRALCHRQRVGQRDLTGLVDEEDVDLLAHVFTGPQPRCAREQPNLVRRCGDGGGVVDDLDAVAAHGGVRLGVALLAAEECDAGLVGGSLDLFEELGDGLVRRGRHADPEAAVHQVDGEPTAGVRLAGSRRALDEECRRLERRHLIREHGEVDGSAGQRRSAGREAWRAAQQQVDARVE
jgi:hypothetical protein